MAGEKEFSAKVPENEYDRFRQAFPMYGAVNWFINTMLKTFNDAVEASPDSRAHVRSSVEQMLAERREK